MDRVKIEWRGPLDPYESITDFTWHWFIGICRDQGLLMMLVGDKIWCIERTYDKGLDKKGLFLSKYSHDLFFEIRRRSHCNNVTLKVGIVEPIAFTHSFFNCYPLSIGWRETENEYVRALHNLVDDVESLLICAIQPECNPIKVKVYEGRTLVIENTREKWPLPAVISSQDHNDISRNVNERLRHKSFMDTFHKQDN